MGFFSKLFGSQPNVKHKSLEREKSLSLSELAKNSTENGILYKMESAREDDKYDVFFFDADDQKICLRETGTDGRKQTITLDKLGQYEISISSAIQSNEEKTQLHRAISTRETDSFYGFYYLNSNGLEQDWPEGILVRDEGDSLVVKKSKRAKKEYTVKKKLIFSIEFYAKEDLDQ